MIILYLILYSARDKNVTYIVEFSSLQSEKKKTALIILYLVLYSARSRSVTYIAHFLGLRSEIVNFRHSLSRTLFGKQQKCNIQCRFFRFLE